MEASDLEQYVAEKSTGKYNRIDNPTWEQYTIKKNHLQQRVLKI